MDESQRRRERALEKQLLEARRDRDAAIRGAAAMGRRVAELENEALAASVTIQNLRTRAERLPAVETDLELEKCSHQITKTKAKGLRRKLAEIEQQRGEPVGWASIASVAAWLDRQDATGAGHCNALANRLRAGELGPPEPAEQEPEWKPPCADCSNSECAWYQSCQATCHRSPERAGRAAKSVRVVLPEQEPALQNIAMDRTQWCAACNAGPNMIGPVHTCEQGLEGEEPYCSACAGTATDGESAEHTCDQEPEEPVVGCDLADGSDSTAYTMFDPGNGTFAQMSESDFKRLTCNACNAGPSAIGPKHTCGMAEEPADDPATAEAREFGELLAAEERDIAEHGMGNMSFHGMSARELAESRARTRQLARKLERARKGRELAERDTDEMPTLPDARAGYDAEPDVFEMRANAELLRPDRRVVMTGITAAGHDGQDAGDEDDGYDGKVLG